MPEVSLPTGILISSIKTWLEKKLLLPTYVASHRIYLKRSGFLTMWNDLGFGVSSSIALPSILDNERVPYVRLAVKTDEAGLLIDKLEILVQATSDEGIYQDLVQIYKVNNVPTIVALPSVPLRSLFFTDSNHIVLSFSKLDLTVLSVAGERTYLPEKPANYSHLRLSSGSFDLLNERFEKRWDAFWNLGAVDRAILEQSHWFKYYLTSPRVYYPSSAEVPLQEIPKAILRRVIGRPVCWILTRPWLLKTYFWVPIFLRLKRFEALP